jgi:hypothetical protein
LFLLRPLLGLGGAVLHEGAQLALHVGGGMLPFRVLLGEELLGPL